MFYGRRDKTPLDRADHRGCLPRHFVEHVTEKNSRRDHPPRSRARARGSRRSENWNVCHVEQRDFREAVKELAQLDGAFLVEDDGTFVAAARFIDVDLQSASVLPAGLGARHAAGASISGAADAIAVVVFESSVVRVFSRGELRAEIVPEFFHGGADTFFAIEAAEVRELPEVGLTIAFADDGG